MHTWVLTISSDFIDYPSYTSYIAFTREIREQMIIVRVGVDYCNQCGPQKLNNEEMYMVQNGSRTYLTNI